MAMTLDIESIYIIDMISWLKFDLLFEGQGGRRQRRRRGVGAHSERPLGAARAAGG